ncbi:MAG: DUF4367 domain-containing protein [Ruminococcus sp.]|nr:DUF4367 domain-containing protein [Ruminococcus sp.]
MEMTAFRNALSSVCENELICNEQDVDIRFSAGFEQRMEDIIHPKEKVFIRKRLKIALVMAAMLAAGFLVGMTSGGRWGFFFDKTDEGLYATFDVRSVKDPKKKITEVYELGFIPDGYTLTDSHVHPFGQYVNYFYEVADRGEKEWKCIFFSQCVPYSYRDVYIGKDDKSSIITEGELQYYISQPEDDYTTIVWYQDGYVMVLSATIGKDDALELCRTVRVRQ